MARYTRPVPGRSDTYPNAGPYTSDQWAELLNITHVGDEATTRGPYASYLNRLEVTNPAGADFQIDTGAGLCNGHLLINDAAVTITADTPAANPRIDRVVMVYNNTNAAINATTVGGFTFNVAGGGTDIPAYTCELAIMKGAENAAPALPALEQDAARLWMVELARYQISVVPAITNFTDYRDYVDAETKRILIPFVGGYNVTDAVEATYGPGSFPSLPFGYIALASKDSYFSTYWVVPEGIIGDVVSQPHALDPVAAAGSFFYLGYEARYCVCSDNYEANVDSIGPIQVATIGNIAHNVVMCLPTLQITLSSLSAGDRVYFEFWRKGNDANDTAAANLIPWGAYIEYLGYRR